MRWITASICVAALLASGQVLATGGISGRGETGGKGGPGPGSTAGGAGLGSSGSVGLGANPTDPDADLPGRAKPRTKPWEVEGIWETHRLVRSNDLGGYAVNKTVNVAFVYARYDFTKYDRIWLRGGAYDRFIADETESGFRLDDVVGAYSRLIPLPEKLNLRLTAQASAPTSFIRQKEGLITEGRLTAGLDRKFGRFFLNLRTFGGAHLMRYSTAQGGNANPLASWATTLGAEYQIPYIEALYLGAMVGNEYVWYYNTADAGTVTSQQYGAVQDPNFPHQPVQQSYGAEIYLRYVAPELVGIRSDLSIAYAQGDPSLGYTSALHDGVRHFYPVFWRQTSEVYVALTATY